MKKVRGTVNIYNNLQHNSTTFNILDCSKNAPVNKGVLEMGSTVLMWFRV